MIDVKWIDFHPIERVHGQLLSLRQYLRLCCILGVLNEVIVNSINYTSQVYDSYALDCQ